MPILLRLVPRAYGNYFEPFLGGGAMFFRIRPLRAVVSDTNSELMNCYTQVRNQPARVLHALTLMKNEESSYYHVRNSNPRGAIARAARLIYLVNLSFNGIYRVNRRGGFNVPYGGRHHLLPANRDSVCAASSALSSAALRCCDFEEALADAERGDFVYLDPPYTVAHENNGFIRYNAKVFSWTDQARLAQVAHRLAAKGCVVIVSNANHPSVTSLYKGFSQIMAPRSSLVAASAHHRRRVTELILTNVTPTGRGV